jgi:hypothetical protein
MPDKPPVSDTRNAAHWTLLRDVAVLQFKLLVDGLRDLVLVPASLIAAAISVVNSADGRPGPEFYRLLAIGKDSERRINLFGALENSPDRDSSESPEATAGDIDALVARLESYVVDEYQRGGVTRQAKERIDKVLDALVRRGR